jgi:formylglycine-generating enzyme required for sulfatase activity
MHGNVWEWCEDHWHDSYQGAPMDGSAWVNFAAEEKDPKLLRGGSWFNYPYRCRSAYRLRYYSVIHKLNCGFRVAYSSARILQ